MGARFHDRFVTRRLKPSCTKADQRGNFVLLQLEAFIYAQCCREEAMAADKGFSLPTAQQAMEKLALAEAEKASAAAPKQAELDP